MSKERTDAEIASEIKWIEDNRVKIPRYSAFGDDNQAKLHAALEVLRENLDEDEVFEKQEDGEWDEVQVEAAREVLNWRDEGDDEARPSVTWAGLVGLPPVKPLPPPQ